MSHVPYLVAGYGLTAAILGSYAAWVVRRERALSRDLGVPSTRRRRPAPTATADTPSE